MTKNNKLLVTFLQVGFAIPKDDHREMLNIYTRWVHDADCQHLQDFTTQGTKLTWKLLDDMWKKLRMQSSVQSARTQAVLKALPKETPNKLTASLKEANEQRSKDCIKFLELQDHYRTQMNKHEKAIKAFQEILSRGEP
jgi:vacuolar-type H+-ATPase subunit I/STV1